MKFKKILVLVLFVALSLPVFAGTDAQLEYNKGIDFYKLGQYDKSMEAFRNAISLDADYIDAYYNLGSILEYLEQYDAALTVFKQIIVRKPTDYEAVLKAADLSKKLGQNQKALDFLSLIPSSSTYSVKANELAKGIKGSSVNNSSPVVSAPTQPVKNGIYENIPSPTGITSDINGNLYVAGYADNVIYKITPNGDKIIYLKDKRINGPIGLIYDDLGNLYIANYNANNVLKVDKFGSVSIFVSDIMKPYCVFITNKTLFVSSQGSNAVVRVKL